MDAEVGLLKTLLERFDQLEIVSGAAAVLGAIAADREAQLLADVAAGALIKAEEAPGAAPVEPEGEVPGHTEVAHGCIEVAAEALDRLLGVGIGQRQATLKHLPEGLDLGGVAIFGVGEEPRLLVVEHRDALEALGERFFHAQELGQGSSDGSAVAVFDAAVEQAEQGERIDVLDEALTAIGELIPAEQAEILHAGLELLQKGNQPAAIGSVSDQPIGNGLVETRPTEALVLFGIGAEAFPPVRVVAEAVDVLRFVLEGEIDQGIGFPIAGGDLPDRGLVGVEVPLADRANALPMHA